MERKHYSSLSELLQRTGSPKDVQCPHCGAAGALIRHGVLRGYGEHDSTRVVRGVRFFCSNRYLRPGCGRTVSTLLSQTLRRYTVSASTVWRFLQLLAQGSRTAVAWRKVADGFCLRSGYRIRRMLEGAQFHHRTLLCQIRPPPPGASDRPLSQLAAHFLLAFPLSPCPLADFQNHFQLSVAG